MPNSWKNAIIASWIVIALVLAYLVWGHWSMKSWGRATKASVEASHEAQKADINRIGPLVIPGFTPTEPTPGTWPPPDPPTFP
jgi:hypothetical protein